MMKERLKKMEGIQEVSIYREAGRLNRSALRN